MFRPLILATVIAFVPLMPGKAQTSSTQAPPHQAAEMPIDDPLVPPSELAAFARRASHSFSSSPQKLQALLTAMFRSPEDGGLGIVYDNVKSRSIKEVWEDRKANCLGLTSLFVAASRSIGIEVHYAEPVNTSRWHRNGGLVRFERHVVAMALIPPMEDLVADFLPKLQKRESRYVVTFLTEERVRALWAANRAVECMEAGEMGQAEAFASKALAFDPQCGIGWNTLGVLRTMQGNRRDAEACYRKALLLDRTDGAAIGNMENLLRTEGRWEEALNYRRLGLELRRRDPYFQAFLAEEAIAEGRFEEAQTYIKAAIKLQPYDPDLYVIEAGIRISLGRGQDAEKSLELARKWATPRERDRFDTKLAAIRQFNG